MQAGVSQATPPSRPEPAPLQGATHSPSESPLQNHLLMATGPQGPTMLCGVGHERSKFVQWCNSRPTTDIFKRSYAHQQDGSAVRGSSAKPDNPSLIPGMGATWWKVRTDSQSCLLTSTRDADSSELFSGTLEGQCFPAFLML